MEKIGEFIYRECRIQIWRECAIHMGEDRIKGFTKDTYLYSALVETDNEEWETDWMPWLSEVMLHACTRVEDLEFKTNMGL